MRGDGRIMNEKYPNLSDGWHDYNPNHATCEECGSSDVEFLWNNGKPVGFHCKKCGNEGIDK